MNDYYVYIMTNYHGNVMYIGMTNDLERRVSEHKSRKISGFAKRYNICKLVYFDRFSRVEDATICEKKIKSWRRSKKDELVKELNPTMKDLSADWYCDNVEGDPSLRSG